MNQGVNPEMNQEQWLADVGALLADRSRSAMLLCLMDGRAYTAGELARAANIAAPTASHHLEKLERAGVLARVRQGRHSYFRIADDEVAGFIEQALSMQAGLRVRRVTTRCPDNLRHARLCYDHLAGELGVRMLQAGLQREVFTMVDTRIEPGGNAASVLAALGLGEVELPGRFCLDWSERRFHLAGPLASAITRAMLDQRWLLAGERRQLVPTEKGKREMRRWFDCQLP